MSTARATPGTYMYHCHVEDIEHVTMGMTGIVFVRPLQNGNTSYYPSGKYAYNDGDGSTGYDREFAMFLSEIWLQGALGRCPHPGVAMEQLQGGFQPAERTCLSGHAAAQLPDRPGGSIHQCP